ncbi:MAG: polymer-forming cytoskeletal protein [Methyloceanibacter sp.]|uniref:bactofilin family protein n=1 Tax=Methyloceanibacter sp. TaxID=1965321 RepID=UPI001DC840C5|nr:polymer-forming cytoskeletal protein [Methyloceanibacter sp.]MCB1443578.1 polymer-forming cytoskeletal protein [Methyloceanibacter sp.]MCC0058306.1 polymer-forming cytoskeletal protein [Hyphomicrobiaceae bacterium]
MFTKKPEPSGPMAKLGGERPSGVSESKSSPFTDRPSPQPKAPGPAMGKMVPSIIGEDLSIQGNVSSKGEIQVDGQIQGDVHCGSLLLGDKAQINGSVVAEDVVVRGKVMGSIRGLRVTLQSQSHVEGDIYHQSLAIEQGAYFEGKSRRSDNPMEGASSGAKPSSAAPTSGNPFSSNAAE